MYICTFISLSVARKVIEFLQPEELKTKIDLKLVDDPVDNERLEQLALQVIRYSMKTGRP